MNTITLLFYKKLSKLNEMYWPVLIICFLYFYSSAGSAVPVMDLSKVSYTLDDGEEIWSVVFCS